MKQQQYTNELINSTSPYLLQHAHNPVNWHPWSDELIEKAQNENKLLLVSIGYAACHWCHVMEHECFEDVEVAEVMNVNFICIKVDREERPDVDHYYMTAVHLMGQQGGWPLNVIALPDGRPVWGGTYFPKALWMRNILAVADFFRQNREKTEEYAAGLQNGIQQTALTQATDNPLPANKQITERAVENWKERFDTENGGSKGAPKFPMPVNLDFLLYYGFIKNNSEVLDFIELTLEKMARGGIYDQIGGGFARYSVDEKWKVPHFEKMLYDNGQLLSVYSKAYQFFKKDEFKTVVYETAGFIERELSRKNGALYSSLDADSEGEEGKFYVWKIEELKSVLSNDYELFADYYNVGTKGFWERGKNILLRDEPDETFAERNKISENELQHKIKHWKTILLDERAKRVRPALDDKTVTSWSAMVIQGLADAFKATGDGLFKTRGIKYARFVEDKLMKSDGKLSHAWKNNKSSSDGFMEDYALTIHAFLALYEITGVENWLESSRKLTDYTFRKFYDEQSNLFFFSEKTENKSVLTNHFQNEDNVIPAANSVMANNLHKLYLLLGKPEYSTISKKMIQNVTALFPKYPMAFAKWGSLMLKLTEQFYEIAICGNEAEDKSLEMQEKFCPNAIFAFSESESDVPVLKGRFVTDKTLIYVCEEGNCKLPVESVAKAAELIKIQ